MGIAIKELLALEYFKDFEVIAGYKGINREIQGITVMDAPDAFRWTRGRELILTTGYAISKEPECIRKGFEDGTLQKCSGLVIKKERYLNNIPEDIINSFEKYDIPLITMPFQVPYMEIMNQVNIAVMNRTIRRFRIHSKGIFHPSNLSYKEQKIKRILQAVEAEMNFPAFLYDLAQEKNYYSSANFNKIAQSFGIKECDFWNPSQNYTKHTLCDYTGMVRYRLIEEQNSEGKRVSWITIPIIMNEVEVAYFVVMESRELLDYYDEYSIRIAFIMLQGVYEQIMVAQNIGNIGFENFVNFVLNYSEKDDLKKLLYQAQIQGISTYIPYEYVVFRQTNEKITARSERKDFIDVLQKTNLSHLGKIAFIGENEGVLFLDSEELKRVRKNDVYKLLRNIDSAIKLRCPDMQLIYGTCNEKRVLTEMKQSIEKCQRVLEMGPILFPKHMIWDYEKLGPLTWLQIPTDELEEMLKTYKLLLKDEKNIEILRTLKVYVENNMNFSITAEKMYVHINTIRKRVEKINDLLNIDWEQPFERLKVELLLQFLDLDK